MFCNLEYLVRKISIAVLGILSLLYLIVSCSNPSQENENSLDIIGKWELVKSVTFWPSSSKIDWTDSVNTKTIEFLNNNNVIIKFPDNSTNECNWAISGDSLFICDNYYLQRMIKDTLVLSQSHLDGESEYFLKF